MILDEIRKELKENVDLNYRKGSINFFKEKIRIHGVRSKIVRNIANKHFKEIKDLDKKEILNLCEKLLKTNYNEEATIAFSWCYKIKENINIKDFHIFELWVNKYLTNWAMVDDFCTHSLGSLIIKNPGLIHNIKKWTKTSNKWTRRAAAVTLIHCVKRNKNLEESFTISDLLMKDKEDLVQKGYGWLLKEASKNYQKEVFNYVMKNKENMPRTALRYAIENMPDKLKSMAMSKTNLKNFLY